MNGKKRKNKKMALDSGKVCRYLREGLGITLLYYKQIF
jgi:hypothetical protein